MENLEDAKAVSKLVIRCLKEINSQFYGEDVIKSMIEVYQPRNIIKIAKKQLVLVAEDINEEIIGTATFSNDIFGSVFVNPDFHGQHYGAKLMKALENLAKAQGSTEVKLHSSVNAINFYLKQGYTKGNEVEDDKFGKSIEMLKKL